MGWLKHVDVKIYLNNKWTEPFSYHSCYYDEENHKYKRPKIDDVIDFIRKHPSYRIYVNKAIQYGPYVRDYIAYGDSLYDDYDTYNTRYYQGEVAIRKILHLIEDGWLNGEGGTYPCEIEFYKTKRPNERSYKYQVDLV